VLLGGGFFGSSCWEEGLDDMGGKGESGKHELSVGCDGGLRCAGWDSCWALRGGCYNELGPRSQCLYHFYVHNFQKNVDV
jgi:hypothetical protein